MSYTRVYCSNSSLRDSSFMLNSIIKESIFLTKQAKHNNEEIELQRRQEQKRQKNKNNEASQVTNQRSKGGSDEGEEIGSYLMWVYLIGSVFVGLFLGLFFIWVWWVIFSPSSSTMWVGLFLGFHLGLVFFFCRVVLPLGV